MTVLAGASASGAPGVTSSLSLLAALWPQSPAVPILLEAGACGGTMAGRHLLSMTPGFVSLAESLRSGEPTAILDHAQRLPSGVACVPLAPAVSAARAQLRSSAGALGGFLQRCGHPVLLDVGRHGPDAPHAAALAEVDQLLWFVRPDRESLLALRHRIAETPMPERVAVVTIGGSPYRPGEVAEALGVEPVHLLPFEPRAADALISGGRNRRLRRSRLARAAAALAVTLAAGMSSEANGPSADHSSSAGPEASATGAGEGLKTS